MPRGADRGAMVLRPSGRQLVCSADASPRELARRTASEGGKRRRKSGDLLPLAGSRLGTHERVQPWPGEPHHGDNALRATGVAAKSNGSRVQVAYRGHTVQVQTGPAVERATRVGRTAR